MVAFNLFLSSSNRRKSSKINKPIRNTVKKIWCNILFMLHCTASENVMKTSVMEFISENSWWLKPVNYYSKKLHHRDLHNIFWDIAKWCKIFWPQLFQQKYFMRVMERIGELVGNNAKGRISKRVLRENKAHQIYRKTDIFYPVILGVFYLPLDISYPLIQGVRNVHFSENLVCFVFR